MRRMSCVGVVVGALALGASSAAASNGPPTPPNCTFSNGITVCETQSSSTSTYTVPAPQDGPGCYDTIVESFTSTTFTAHRGAPDSQGAPVTPPPSYATGSETITPSCTGS